MTSIRPPIANRYQLHRQLASGSYAETWLSTDIALERNVAVKRLHAPDDGREHDTDQFLREARIAAAVSHPNIVAVFDGGFERGQPYLVMEWVDGRSLKQEILERRRIDIRRAVNISTQLLDGLSAIHAVGIIHRDVKPQNIMVSDAGTVKLTDFGIARLIDEVEANAEGMTTGSAAYMAPEQAQGLPVTPAADIYATGVILYEMLTGRLPFNDLDPQLVMLKHVSEPVIRPRKINPAIPVEIESIILRSLSKDPLERYQTADDMRYELLRARKTSPVRQRATLMPPAAVDWALPRFAWMAASVTIFMVMVVGATTLAVRGANTPSETAELPVSIETPVTAETVEPEPTSTSVPSWAHSTREANTERGNPLDNDDFVVRGDITVPNPSEPSERVNRPAPFRDATEDDEDSSEVTASTGNTQANEGAWQPVDQPEDEEPVDSDDAHIDDDEASEETQEESSSEGTDDESSSGSEGANNDVDDSGESVEPGNDQPGDDTSDNSPGQGNGPPDHANNNDDAPAANQNSGNGESSSHDDDTPATPQEHVDDDAASDDDDAEGTVNENDEAEEDEVELTMAQSADQQSTS